MGFPILVRRHLYIEITYEEDSLIYPNQIDVCVSTSQYTDSSRTKETRYLSLPFIVGAMGQLVTIEAPVLDRRYSN